MCCHFVEGGLLEQAEDLVYYLVDIRGVVEFFQLFVEFVFHLFADLVGQFVNFCRILKRLFYLFYLRFIESYRINRQVGFFFSFACFFRLISILLASIKPFNN